MDNRAKISVRAMCEQDLETVLAIESASFPRPWTRRHFLDEIASSCSIPLVALSADDRLVGYLCLKLVLDEAEILDVAVADAERGRGIGRILVESALKLCREREMALLFLEVRVSNQPAIALYLRHGFRESGRRKRYYENGEDAMLMEYTFERQVGERDAV
jgi:[ribosomal protein S18]-alanine N-acetyltransferase